MNQEGQESFDSLKNDPDRIRQEALNAEIQIIRETIKRNQTTIEGLQKENVSLQEIEDGKLTEILGIGLSRMGH